MKREIVLIFFVFLLSVNLFSSEILKIQHNGVQMRNGPAIYYDLEGYLKKGIEVEKITETENWIEIKTAAGKTGWITAGSVSKVKGKSVLEKFTFMNSDDEIVSPVTVAAAVKGFCSNYLEDKKSNSSFIEYAQQEFFTKQEYLDFLNSNYKELRKEYYSSIFKSDAKAKRVIDSYENIKMDYAIGAQISSAGLIENSDLMRYLNIFANIVGSFSDAHHIRFKVFVLDTNDIEAYTTPNGFIFISAGLLKLIENESQLSFLFAHEISHVVFQHGVKEMIKRSVMIEADEAFMELEKEIDEDFSQVEYELDKVSSEIYNYIHGKRLLKYELEADRYGLLYTIRAHYAPVSASEILESINHKTENHNHFVDLFTRIERLGKEIKKYYKYGDTFNKERYKKEVLDRLN